MSLLHYISTLSPADQSVLSLQFAYKFNASVAAIIAGELECLRLLLAHSNRISFLRTLHAVISEKLVMARLQRLRAHLKSRI